MLVYQHGKCRPTALRSPHDDAAGSLSSGHFEGSVIRRILGLSSAAKTRTTRSVAAAVFCAIALSRCGAQPQLQDQWGDPVSRTFEHCSNLFTASDNHHECVFSDRRERGYDVVEDQIKCLQNGADVDCRLRPGAGPGPDQNWMDYQCDRISHVCRITGGDLGFISSYSALFAGHNAGLQSGSNLPVAESR
jgi:hypothetical protein